MAEGALSRGLAATGAFLTELTFLDRVEDDARDETIRLASLDSVSYFGFDPVGPTPFPKAAADTAPGAILEKTLANLCLATKSRPRRLRWALRHPATQALMLDVFWWVFLQNFDRRRRFTAAQRDEQQQRLFSRMAANYWQLFCGLRARLQPPEVDEALRFYPDALCQAVYRAYYTCFPDARPRFGDNFKSALLQTVTFWLTGIPVGGHNNSLKWTINPSLTPHPPQRPSSAAAAAAAPKADYARPTAASARAHAHVAALPPRPPAKKGSDEKRRGEKKRPSAAGATAPAAAAAVATTPKAPRPPPAAAQGAL